jgi:hypothetical protein
VTLCAIYPNQDPNRPYRCLPNKIGKAQKVKTNIDGGLASIQFEDGGGEIRLVDVSVDFVVRVPKSAGFIGITVDGRVETKSLDNDVTAHSVLGDVMIELPSGGGAKVEAESDTGEIKSDWPLARKSRNGLGLGQSAHGVIGSGQSIMRLNTVTGNIRLRRAQKQ